MLVKFILNLLQQVEVLQRTKNSTNSQQWPQTEDGLDEGEGCSPRYCYRRAGGKQERGK